MKKLTVGMLAHVDSGKTTLSEEMLYRAGVIREKGRVDHGDSFLDFDKIEKRRGITIFSKQARLDYGDTRITLLDTPGHVDFSSEMERTISVLDLAILIIGANDGIMPHTRTLWKLLERSGVPVFLFVNKMDLAVKRESGILDDLRRGLSEKAVSFTGKGRSLLTEERLEELSMFDDDLAEMILDERPYDELMAEVVRTVSERKAFPVFFGAALKGEGVEALLDGVTYLSGDKYGGKFEEKLPSGKIFKVSRDGGDKVAFIKLEEGRIRPKDSVKVNHRDNDPEELKINEIREYVGDKYSQLQEAAAGDIVGVTGLSSVEPGDTLGSSLPGKKELLEPFMTYTVTPEDPSRRHDLMDAMTILTNEDPKLFAEADRDTGEIKVRIMGAVQTEVLKEVIRKRFGIEAGFTGSRIIYKETLTGEVEGVGHFEPLRHYAEVHLIMRPGAKGSGITVKNECPPDKLDGNWQNLILHHITERPIKGVLAGAALTDCEIILVAGRAHQKHTEGGDFREATWRAIRQGLMTAREEGELCLLEPVLSFEIDVEQDDAGHVMTDVTNMGGRLEDPVQSEEGRMKIMGEAPVAGMEGYMEKLMGYTSGSARMSTVLSGYERCKDEKAVIEASGYVPERDTEYTADSVFCSKGSSDIVPWNEVYGKMHIASVLMERNKSGGAGNGSDESLMNEALIEKRKREYREKLATDRDLIRIFERTYGAIRKRETPKKGEEESFDAPRRENEEKDGKWAGKVQRPGNSGSPVETARYLFVDGYNLIHAWPELKSLSDTDYGAARDRLIDLISNYSAFMGTETTLVFDAYRVTEGIGSSEELYGIKVVYTKEHETADAYIERVTHELMKKLAKKTGEKGRSEILVVSSDALVQQLALGHGAIRMSSREFVDEISRVGDVMRELYD